jgi:hypothetical protein
MTKKYHIKAEDIRPLATGRGGCVATDAITIEGRKIGFMYRDRPDRPEDSGWRFMVGDEDQDYMDDPDNHGIYDVNIIANYEPLIVPLLDSPAGSVFERLPGTKGFRPVKDWSPPED